MRLHENKSKDSGHVQFYTPVLSVDDRELMPPGALFHTQAVTMQSGILELRITGAVLLSIKASLTLLGQFQALIKCLSLGGRWWHILSQAVGAAHGWAHVALTQQDKAPSPVKMLYSVDVIVCLAWSRGGFTGARVACNH